MTTESRPRSVAGPAGVRPRSFFSRSSSRSSAVFLSAVFLSACSNLSPQPGPAPALDIPSRWSTATGSDGPATPLADWWRRLDDPLLSALIDEALQANTSVQGAMAALRQSRAQGDVQVAGLGPTLRGSASAQRSRNGDAGTGNAFRAGFDAAWEPDVFGGQRAAVNAAAADTRASAASLADVQVSVAAEVALNVLQWRGTQARLAIARSSLASQAQTLQIVDWRQQAGLATGLDLEQARGATEQTRAQIPSLLSAAGQAEHSLAVLVSRSPTSLHERMSAFTAPPAPPAAGADALVLAIPAETLRQRPDVRAAEARVAAAWARVAQADAARYPSFNLSGSLGLGAATLGSLAKGSSVLASVLASVAGPIFDGGAGRAQVRAQQAAYDQAGSAYAATVFTALKEVEDSLLALRNGGERLRSLGLAADAARKAARLADQRYRSGLIDFQVVLETQRSQLATQDSLAGTAAELDAERVRLYKALGGGWQAELAPTAGLAAETASAATTVATQATTP